MSLIIAGTLSNCVYAKDYVKNDLRTLFLNNQAIIYEINMRSFNAQDKNGNEITGDTLVGTGAKVKIDGVEKYTIVKLVESSLSFIALIIKSDFVFVPKVNTLTFALLNILLKYLSSLFNIRTPSFFMRDNIFSFDSI